MATRAITGVLFGLTIAIVLKSDLCITYPTFSGAMYIFSFCEFRVIFYPRIEEFLAELDDYD